MTTTLLDDYDNVLKRALIALNSRQTEDFVKECKRNEKEGSVYPQVPKTVIDELLEIWDIVFPQRSIKIEDSKVIAFKQMENTDTLYKGNEMSDGERVALYLIAQCLSVPANKVLIVDEPELHLHRSIMNRLWCELEKKRSDCLFIYITHDTNFAALHSQAKRYG